MLENGKIAVGFHRKAQRMRHAGESMVQFAKCVGDGCAAIHIGRRLEFRRRVRKGHAFAKNLFTMRSVAGFWLPAKMRAEGGGVYCFQTGVWRDSAHRDRKST